MDYGHRSNGSQVTGIFSGSTQYRDQLQKQNSDSQVTENPYFTDGIGNMPADSNDFEPENNLDEDNWRRSLEISAPTDMPTPELLQEKSNYFFNAKNTIGNFPTNFSDETPNSEKTDDFKPSATSKANLELGEIVPISTNLSSNSSSVPSSSSDQQNAHVFDSRVSYNPVNIRTSGDRLEKSTIPEVDNIINELNQTGNLSNFYDEIRGTDDRPGMMEVNLDNSFNRKLGQDQMVNTEIRRAA